MFKTKTLTWLAGVFWKLHFRTGGCSFQTKNKASQIIIINLKQENSLVSKWKQVIVMIHSTTKSSFSASIMDYALECWLIWRKIDTYTLLYNMYCGKKEATLKTPMLRQKNLTLGWDLSRLTAQHLLWHKCGS